MGGIAAMVLLAPYATLSDMKRRGIMLPTDEQYLEVLREKAGIS